MTPHKKTGATRWADSAYAGLLVHLALAVQRLKKEEKITIDQKLLADLKQKKEYQIGAHIAQSIGRDFSLAVPEDEIGYITMHLLGAKNQYSQEKTVAQAVGSFQLVKLAKENDPDRRKRDRAIFAAGREFTRGAGQPSGTGNQPVEDENGYS